MNAFCSSVRFPQFHSIILNSLECEALNLCQTPRKSLIKIVLIKLCITPHTFESIYSTEHFDSHKIDINFSRHTKLTRCALTIWRATGKKKRFFLSQYKCLT